MKIGKSVNGNPHFIDPKIQLISMPSSHNTPNKKLSLAKQYHSFDKTFPKQLDKTRSNTQLVSNNHQSQLEFLRHQVEALRKQNHYLRQRVKEIQSSSFQTYQNHLKVFQTERLQLNKQVKQYKQQINYYQQTLSKNLDSSKSSEYQISYKEQLHQKMVNDFANYIGNLKEQLQTSKLKCKLLQEQISKNNDSPIKKKIKNQINSLKYQLNDYFSR